MIDRSVLVQAKSFLCWDKFSELSIKLIPLGEPVAFFYPPRNDMSTILVFYNSGYIDFTKPLYLLFHEMGHYIQWKEFLQQNMEEEYWQIMNLDRGNEKYLFEKEAWILGKNLLIEFLRHRKILIPELEKNFDPFSEKCLTTYK